MGRVGEFLSPKRARSQIFPARSLAELSRVMSIQQRMRAIPPTAFMKSLGTSRQCYPGPGRMEDAELCLCPRSAMDFSYHQPRSSLINIRTC